MSKPWRCQAVGRHIPRQWLRWPQLQSLSHHLLQHSPAVKNIWWKQLSLSKISYLPSLPHDCSQRLNRHWTASQAAQLSSLLAPALYPHCHVTPNYWRRRHCSLDTQERWLCLDYHALVKFDIQGDVFLIIFAMVCHLMLAIAKFRLHSDIVCR